jgi:predicted HTH transcriptional regulator
MDGLITVPEIVHELPIVELIRLGESATLEFKSTLQWDVIQGKQNTGLRKQVLKTVAAFLNSAGGTLVIGVEDDGNVYGLENDLVLVNKSPDKFANLVTSLLTEEIGGEFASFIRLRLEQLNGQQICVVDVTAAKEPVYIKGERGSEFYIRFGPTSRMLDTEEAVNYISMHWE